MSSEAFDARELVRLAMACRKAGIKNFKGFGVEFTLTEDAPESAYKRAKAANVAKPIPHTSDDSEVKNEDELTEQELLMWSVGPEAEKAESA